MPIVLEKYTGSRLIVLSNLTSNKICKVVVHKSQLRLLLFSLKCSSSLNDGLGSLGWLFK